MTLSLFALFSVLLSPHAQAEESFQADPCPELNGHFTCVYDGQFGHHVFELDGQTTHNARGETIYIINKKEIYTDGKKHHADTLPILEEWADDVNYTGTCNGENRIHIVGDARVKQYNRRADLDGDLIKHNERELSASFRVKMGFFGTDINVPCVKKTFADIE